jgi:hypothetical protein
MAEGANHGKVRADPRLGEVNPTESRDLIHTLARDADPADGHVDGRCPG